MLDLSKIEAGRLELERLTFDLQDCVRTACAPFEMAALQRDLGFEFEIASEAEGAYVGDAIRIRQVLANIVANAVKFTNLGAVTVRVYPAATSLRFEVQDTGIGITALQQARLFEKFSQGDASVTRRYGGTGLGLAICRDLVSLMGGRLELSSEPEKGSVFAFELPLERARASEAPLCDLASAEEARAQEHEHEHEGPVRVLAADDNPINRLVLQALLEPMGVDLVQVEDGEEAVLAFANGHFDLVLMDIQMPRMSGVEAAEKIRALEKQESRIRTPMLALTANVMAHQVDEYRGVGIDGCVAKPLLAERLYRAISDALAAAQQPIPAPARTLSNAGR